MTDGKIFGLSLACDPSRIPNAIFSESKLSKKKLRSKHPMRWKAKHIGAAITLLGINPPLTFQEVIEAQVPSGGILISRPTLEVYSDAELITYKSIPHHSQVRRTEDLLPTGVKWSEWFPANRYHPFVYLDDFADPPSVFTSHNQSCNAAQLRTVTSGQLAIQVTHANAAEHVSLARAIHRRAGMVCHRVSETAFNQRLFDEFAEEVRGSSVSNPVSPAREPGFQPD
jgi:hypothetical protein